MRLGRVGDLISPCWTGKYGGHPSHRRVFLFNHFFTYEILDVWIELMPFSSSPLTPDRNQTPEATYAVRPSGASDCRSFLCVKMRSSRCHSDLILSKYTPSRPNPVVDRAPCFDAQYGLHSLGNPRKWDGAICGLRRASPGSGWAGCGAGLLKQVRCQLHVLALCCATCHMAGLPAICDVKLVSHTMGDGISPSAWSRGNSNPEKPTQGAPARAECPTPAARSAPSGAHRTQNAQVLQ